LRSEPEFHAEVGAETVVFLLDGTGRVRFVKAQRLVGQIHEVAEDREVPGNRVTRRKIELGVRIVIDIGRAGSVADDPTLYKKALVCVYASRAMSRTSRRTRLDHDLAGLLGQASGFTIPDLRARRRKRAVGVDAEAAEKPGQAGELLIVGQFHSATCESGRFPSRKSGSRRIVRR